MIKKLALFLALWVFSCSPKANLPRSILPVNYWKVIVCQDSALPLQTASQNLKHSLERLGTYSISIQSLVSGVQKPRLGSMLIGTPSTLPILASWIQSGRINAITESSTVDNYEIAVVDGSVAIVGSNPRAALYATYKLEDVLHQFGGIPVNFRESAKPVLGLRMLHPRARGGFTNYKSTDFEFIARTGGNLALLQHDWMKEKTLFSFVECPEFPNVTPASELKTNREQLRQYLDWCRQYGLGAGLWLCEVVCQGGPWVATEKRAAFLDLFPAEVLSESGSHQGKVLCMAHPKVEQAYRKMVRQLLTDFPELQLFLTFTLDSNGELCDPASCERHRGVSKLTQYNQFQRLLLDETRKLRPDFQVISVVWSWKFRKESDFLSQQAALPPGTGLATLPDAEAWSFDRKITNALRSQAQVTHQHQQSLIGYDIFRWGDDTIFPSTELYDFPLGVAAKLRRWQALGVDGIFDQWGTQAEYVPANAIALREMFFHPELTQPPLATQWVDQLALSQYGKAAGPMVSAAWKEIETAQQIQSDFTYYWHQLRPNWAKVSLTIPLTIEALRVVNLSIFNQKTLTGIDPSKLDGTHAYGPTSDDVAAAQATGIELQKTVAHFQAAANHLKDALNATPTDQPAFSSYWLPVNDAERKPVSARQQLEKQWISVRLQAEVQRELAHFFTSYSLVKSLSKEDTSENIRKLAQLRAIQTEAAITSPMVAQFLEQTGTKGRIAQQFRDRVAGLPPP
ncbi:hypothetical protein GO755_00715 [Spirosoma sp. HMF4905]|uniref:Beta-hexosaminidase bacterial type N-terminal domain-containing protein n=1 Tax=Spirosoma arboris TaxID=2682092 RepID=A0A7K1S3Y0_9BACT|nr:hypothetical protein [Spirosoma arboris]MVM28533.1 hypothetical protein [Spirosoma arboris]